MLNETGDDMLMRTWEARIGHIWRRTLSRSCCGLGCHWECRDAPAQLLLKSTPSSLNFTKLFDTSFQRRSLQKNPSTKTTDLLATTDLQEALGTNNRKSDMYPDHNHVMLMPEGRARSTSEFSFFRSHRWLQEFSPVF